MREHSEGIHLSQIVQNFGSLNSCKRVSPSSLNIKFLLKLQEIIFLDIHHEICRVHLFFLLFLKITFQIMFNQQKGTNCTRVLWLLQK